MNNSPFSSNALEYPYKANFITLISIAGVKDHKYRDFEMFYKDDQQAFTDRVPTTVEDKTTIGLTIHHSM